jgi:YD repeat-containing protein
VVRETVPRGNQRTMTETAYDALGNAVRTAGPFGTMDIARDAAGRVVEVVLGAAGALRLAYDPAGNLVERALPAGGRIAEDVTPDGLVAGVRVMSPQAGPVVRPGEPAWVGEHQACPKMCGSSDEPCSFDLARGTCGLGSGASRIFRAPRGKRLPRTSSSRLDHLGSFGSNGPSTRGRIST